MFSTAHNEVGSSYFTSFSLEEIWRVTVQNTDVKEEGEEVTHHPTIWVLRSEHDMGLYLWGRIAVKLEIEVSAL